jgi:predicted permease
MIIITVPEYFIYLIIFTLIMSPLAFIFGGWLAKRDWEKYKKDRLK